MFEKVQAGPEGFEVVFNLGFNVGVPLWNSFRMAKENVARESASLGQGASAHGLSLFFETLVAERQARLDQANMILAQVSRLLDAVGVTRTVRRRIETRDVEPTSQELRPRSMRLSLTTYRFQNEPQSSERFAVMTFSEEERRLFRKLSHGAAGEEPDKFANDLRELYDDLLERTWRHSSQTMDWLALGLFKGVACGAATFLRLDDLALHAADDSNLTVQMRKRVKTNVEGIDGPTLRASFDYVERMHTDDEGGR